MINEQLKFNFFKRLFHQKIPMKYVEDNSLYEKSREIHCQLQDMLHYEEYKLSSSVNRLNTSE